MNELGLKIAAGVMATVLAAVSLGAGKMLISHEVSLGVISSAVVDIKDMVREVRDDIKTHHAK